MANIQTFLEKILSARYGKDVRQSIHDAIEEVDRVADTAQGSATEAAAQAEQYRNETEQLRNEVAEIVPEGYSDLVEQVNENTIKVDTIIEKADLGIKETATGEEIHLIDSAEGKAVEFALYGKAKQNTTSGKNLLSYPYEETTKTVAGITWTDNNGVITANGTATATTYFNLIEQDLGSVNMNSNTSPTANGYTISADVRSDSDQYAMLYNSTSKMISLVVRSGAKVDNLVFKPMIRLASITDDTWEPYSGGMASPNPQYPQPIEVSGASGIVEVASVCVEQKNKFNYKEVEKTWYVPSGSSVYRKVYTLEPNTPYTLSCDIYGAYEGMGFCFIVSGSNIEFSASSNSNGVSKDKPRTVTTDSKGNLVVGTYLVSSGNSNLTLENANIQLEKGTVVTEYQEFIEKVATIPTENGLAGIKVTENGNYTDQNGQQWLSDVKVKYADGSGEKIQKLKYMKVEKFIGFNRNNGETTVIGHIANDGKTPQRGSNGNVICNIAETLNADQQWVTDRSAIVINYQNQNVMLSVAGIDTIEKLTTYVNEHDVYVLYELAEPIRTPLTAEEIAEIEKLQTFYPITNISNDFDCGMSVTYNADSKNYIDRMVAEQVASIVANMNN